jgi:hypothetical protein
MTVSTTTRKVAYAGDGSSVTFAVPFPFLSASHLQALRTTAGGTTESMSIIASTGAGSPSGGSITVSQPVGAGNSLLILRDTPETQETDYLANDAFPAESHERALDKLTMLVQEMQEEASRALLLPPLEGGVSPLPPASQRAGMFLGFGPGGAPQMVPPTSSPGGGRFSLGGRRIISSTSPNAYLTAADPSWISVDVASGVGMPVGGTIHINSAGVEVGRVFLIQIYSSSGAYPSSGSIQVLCDAFRRYYFSFEPNATPSLAMELVFDGEAWSAIGPDPDWGNTFLPLSAGSGKALTGDLCHAETFVLRSLKDDAGDAFAFRTGYGYDAILIDQIGGVSLYNDLVLGRNSPGVGGMIHELDVLLFASRSAGPAVHQKSSFGILGGGARLSYWDAVLNQYVFQCFEDGRVEFNYAVRANSFWTAGIERITNGGGGIFTGVTISSILDTQLPVAGTGGLIYGTNQLTYSGGILKVGGNGQAYARIAVTTQPGSVGTLRVQSDGVTMWSIGKDDTPHLAANTGSRFMILANDDSGVEIDRPVTISRDPNGTFELLRTLNANRTIRGVASRATYGRHAEFGGGAGSGNAGIVGFCRGSDASIGADIGFLASENETDELRFSVFGSNVSRMAWWTRTTGAVSREVMRLHHSGGLSLGSTTDPGAGRFTTASGIGFHGVAAPTSRPAVSGSRGGNAALQSLLAALHACGIINDTTT